MRTAPFSSWSPAGGEAASCSGRERVAGSSVFRTFTVGSRPFHWRNNGRHKLSCPVPVWRGLDGRLRRQTAPQQSAHSYTHTLTVPTWFICSHTHRPGSGTSAANYSAFCWVRHEAVIFLKRARADVEMDLHSAQSCCNRTDLFWKVRRGHP